MMISLIVVALVGIGFTRLTMLALELRDNFDEVAADEPLDMGRKRIEFHNKFRVALKPEHLVIKNDTQYERPASETPVGTAILGEEGYNSIMNLDAEKAAKGFLSLFGAGGEPKKPSSSGELLGDDDLDQEQPMSEEEESPVDPTDVCTICFEKAKNSVILNCGHGGVCYNCAIDVCVTSGLCPFCREKIDQIVTIAFHDVRRADDGRSIVTVLGPK